MAGRAGTPSASRGGDSGFPRPPRNRNVICKGRTVIRHQCDTEDNRKGDPVLDFDGRRTYRPCEAFGANDTDYCSAHGGNAPQTINAARRTLSLGADEFATTIRNIANDERLPAEVRLKAAAQGLDRVGVRAGVDLGIETPKWQSVLDKMFPDDGADEPDEPPVVEEPAKLESRKRAPRKATPTPSPEPLPDNVVPMQRKAVPRKTPPDRPKFEGWE